MIQFNLLPDVKVEYMRAQAMKRSIIAVSVVVAGIALTVLILLFLVVDVFQKQHLNAVNSDIKTYTNKINTTPNLDKILTIQSQIGSLETLHSQEPVTSRLFGYLQQLIPNNANLSDVKLDFQGASITIDGSADQFKTINQLVDTLKFTAYGTGNIKGNWSPNTSYSSGDMVTDGAVTYTASTNHTSSINDEPGVGSSWQSKWKAAPLVFSNVVLGSFSTGDNSGSSGSNSSNGKNASFSIAANIDVNIFNSAVAAKLDVPSIVTTRSQIDQPNNLFNQVPSGTTSGQ